jgi:hypothetical protein
VQLLIIPKETFLKHWHHPFSPEEFVAFLNHKRAQP